MRCTLWIFALLLVACEEPPCLPVPCPSAAPGGAGCGCTAGTAGPAHQLCDLDTTLAQTAGGYDVVECGTLRADATQEQLETAQRCVLDAVEAKRGVRLVHWGGEDRSAGEAIGAAAAGVVSLYHASDVGTAGVTIGEATCATLQLRPGCQPGAEGLCIECKKQLESSVTCTERAIDENDCRGLGNYQAGKEGSYRPCCPGLREVFQQTEGESNGVRACLDLPLRVYACIEGRCGDGRCEAPEQGMCGCPLDCP